MSASKTEKATPKKRRDAARRGQSFKARDLVVACLSLCGALFVVWRGSLDELGALLIEAIRRDFALDLHRYVADVIFAGLKIVVPVIGVCIVATVLPSLMQSGFSLAMEAVRINFSVLNPINGFKKIFSLRTVKDLIKTLCYLSSFGVAVVLVWWRHRQLIFAQINASIAGIIGIWGKLIISLVMISLACAILILILDALAELFLYLKDLRMDKQEVKREYKELEGDPLTKSKRKEIHIELLSLQDQHDIENSRMVIANPTHVAIAIYFKPERRPIPYVTVRERNQRALAVRRYAEKIGIPVIVDAPLARKMYRTHRRYDMVSMEVIHPVVRLLLWLEEVEMAGRDTEVQEKTDGVAEADDGKSTQ